MSYKKPESVLVVLFDKHHRVLILQRQDDANFWQSVTGALEAGEQPIDAAYREVAEETGLILSPDACPIEDCACINRYEIRPRWQHRYPPGTTHNTEHVFRACIDSRLPLQLTEHLHAEWVSKDEALTRLWSPSNREAVAKFVGVPQ
ncbi:dihydroneopterin triphosphate diphosphatase [Alteromonas halophila]|uniref:NUDIX pyrophosphatase n=1 Tax=Alteromonas halophila TaxID=516698 RepID=A0A918JCL0_9ALTE|nr:dihydroneopterin triphosphate diphosphatase [Alteromonas halophila]GGW74828.1 NUDIX pyrophosphatase [Alteromonas halophila]